MATTNIPSSTNSSSTSYYGSSEQSERAAMEDSKVGSSSRKQFPNNFANESGQWLLFTQYKYSRASLVSAPTGQLVAGSAVALPIPANLGTGYAADWTNREFGMVGNAIGNIVGKVVGNLPKDDPAKWKQSVIDTIKSNGGILDNAKTVINAKVIDSVLGIDGVENATSYAGLARNPFQAFVYNGPQFRNFNFQWKLIPSNLQEANTIRDIIQQFKLGQAPSFESHFANNIFEYPNIFQIQIADADYMFKFAQCVLTGISVDYHGEGQASYFDNNGTKIPFSIILGLNFQEIQIITKEDIQNGGY